MSPSKTIKINNVYPKTAAALMVGPANTKSTSQPRFR